MLHQVQQKLKVLFGIWQNLIIIKIIIDIVETDRLIDRDGLRRGIVTRLLDEFGGAADGRIGYDPNRIQFEFSR